MSEDPWLWIAVAGIGGLGLGLGLAIGGAVARRLRQLGNGDDK